MAVARIHVLLCGIEVHGWGEGGDVCLCDFRHYSVILAANGQQWCICNMFLEYWEAERYVDGSC